MPDGRAAVGRRRRIANPPPPVYAHGAPPRHPWRQGCAGKDVAVRQGRPFRFPAPAIVKDHAMSAVKTLEAVARDRVGKGAARAVRRQGQVPAVIYGGGQPPQSIAVDLIRTRTLIYAGGFKTTLFEINAGGKKVRAIPRDFQLDPVTGVPLHVDFLRVVSGQTVTVEVPVHFVNEDAAPGIKKLGGTLNIVAHTLSLDVAPDQIPDAIEVDLTGHAIGDVIHVSDI